MKRIAHVVSIVLLAGCGRFSFDGSPSPDAREETDAPPDADGSTFAPLSSSCTQADTGPFSAVANYPVGAGGGGFGAYAMSPYVLMADEWAGVNSLRISNGQFQLVGHVQGDDLAEDHIGWVEALWSDGPQLWVGAPGRGLHVIDIAADGALTLTAAERTIAKEARKGWSNGAGVQIVPAGNNGLQAWKLNGTTLEQVGATFPATSWSSAVWVTGPRVVHADLGALELLNFDGEKITRVSSIVGAGGYSRLWIDRNDTVFVAQSAGVAAYRIVNTDLVLLDIFSTTSSVRDVWSDGQHVFAAAEAAGLFALSFTNDRFTLVGQAATGGTTLGVFGDGRYIYANDMNGGLTAFDGFSCRQW